MLRAHAFVPILKTIAHTSRRAPHLIVLGDETLPFAPVGPRWIPVDILPFGHDGDDVVHPGGQISIPLAVGVGPAGIVIHHARGFFAPGCAEISETGTTVRRSRDGAQNWTTFDACLARLARERPDAPDLFLAVHPETPFHEFARALDALRRHGWNAGFVGFLN